MTAGDYSEPELGTTNIVRQDRDVIAVLRSAIRVVSIVCYWLLYDPDISQ